MTLLPAFTDADTITKINGAVIEGRIVAERPDAVVIESESQGMTFRQTVKRAAIRTMQRDKAAAGPAYCPVPISGVIGSDVTAEALLVGFNEARATHSEYVILVIDSPGGDIQEMYKIIDVIQNNRDIKPIAYVRKAISAAAIIALACPRIYMAPGATIGAAVPFRMGPDGTPQLIEEKFESVVRARMRAAARVGGHDERWVRAMSEREGDSATATVDGKKVLVESAGAPSGARIIKHSGQILSATAAEAEAGGLSLGTIPTVDALRTALGLGEWHSAGDRAWFAVMNRAEALRKQQETEARRQAYVRRYGPKVARMQTDLEQWAAKETGAKREADQIRADWQQEAAPIEAEYQRTIQTANGSSEYDRIEVKARQARDRRLKGIEQRYGPQVAKYEHLRDEAHRHVTVITSDMKEMQEQMP